jgi:hypothetical protein
MLTETAAIRMTHTDYPAFDGRGARSGTNYPHPSVRRWVDRPKRSQVLCGNSGGMSLPFLAGVTATLIFASSILPMVVKARRTRDLSSYSLGNIVLANLGNMVQSVYVLSLPPGPIWALHGFYLTTTGLMLVWYLRYGRAVHEPTHAGRDEMGGSPEAAALPAYLA